MKILLNNKLEEFDTETLTVSKLLEVKKFTFKLLIIKINGEHINKEDYGTTEIKKGDNVMVIHLIAGG